MNRALIQKHYKINSWTVSDEFLCPAIPGRTDYLHYLADLLEYKSQKNLKILDVGVGANCIYPILGNSIYGWKFVGTDVNEKALKFAEFIVKSNSQFRDKIKLRHQANPRKMFESIFREKEYFDACMCNPPFFENINQAEKATVRKHQLKKKLKPDEKPKLNFGGQSSEIYYKGGEKAFVLNMINESKNYAENVNWFTCLISKKTNLFYIYKAFDALKIKEHKTIDMKQGNKISRFVAWKINPKS